MLPRLTERSAQRRTLRHTRAVVSGCLVQARRGGGRGGDGRGGGGGQDAAEYPLSVGQQQSYLGRAQPLRHLSPSQHRDATLP
eukprot:scaffold76166_cov69-Phaeocystis_antarctica.AAC.8